MEIRSGNMGISIERLFSSFSNDLPVLNGVISSTAYMGCQRTAFRNYAFKGAGPEGLPMNNTFVWDWCKLFVKRA
jgi:hypothetical protein